MKKLNNRNLAKMIRKVTIANLISILLIVIFSSFIFKYKEKSDNELWEIALRICEKNIVLDSHIDWPNKYFAFPEDISKRITKGDFDLVRAKKGGLNAVLSVAYIGSNLDVDEARIIVDSVIKLVNNYTIIYPDKFAQAKNPEDIEKNFTNNLFSLTLCLENGTPIGDRLKILKISQRSRYCVYYFES